MNGNTFLQIVVPVLEDLAILSGPFPAAALPETKNLLNSYLKQISSWKKIRHILLEMATFKYYLNLIPEMVASMKTVASLDVELTVEERNLLSVAYKNVIGARRASWRIISSIEQKEENKAAEDKLKMIKTYRTQVWILTY